MIDIYRLISATLCSLPSRIPRSTCLLKLLRIEIGREIGDGKDGKYLKKEVNRFEMRRERKEGKVYRRRKMPKKIQRL